MYGVNMEIEGLINHALAAAMVEKSYIAQKMENVLAAIDFWREIQDINSNDQIKSSLSGITHVRQILGSESYMPELIKKSPHESLFYMGYPIKTIEFYIHLRQEVKD